MKTNLKLLKWEGVLVMVALLLAPGLSLATPKKPKNVIGMGKARHIALKTVSGKITDGEMEFENKIWIYSFDMSGKDGKNHEVNVDAITGKVVAATIESPAAEATETVQDKAAAVSTATDQKK
jgi:hypothetical protein